MRTMNLDPFWRTSIGFDRLFDLMDESLRFEPEDHYPPCNIVRTGENSYRISLAVAGFKPEQISVSANQNVLTIAGRAEEKQDKGEYLYHGIAGRSFERRFNLADYVEVKGALLDEGLLQIELERELPEAMKPRRIDIKVGKAVGQGDNVRTIEHSKGCISPTVTHQSQLRWFALEAEPPPPRRGGMAMEHQSKKPKRLPTEARIDSNFDLNALLHPARAFAHPMDVVRDHDLTLNEKRAILASWASDACALEAAPELRINASGSVVRWDDIMDALRILDREADRYGKPLPHYKRVLAKKRAGLLEIRFRSRGRNDQGRLLN